MEERESRDAQELSAMLHHRLTAIEYNSQLLADGVLEYAFFLGESCSTAIMLFCVASHERLDWLIKRDPYFAYTSSEVIPVIDTEALVREAQDYLGDSTFDEEGLSSLSFPCRQIDPDAEYWFAWKQVPPFSPLCPIETQNDVHRRTIEAQKAHLEHLEFADHNPVGRPIGILISEASLEHTRAHVEQCDVFPDTLVTYSRLWTHKQAEIRTRSQLREMRRVA
jgi:hypothetical protein